MKEEDKDKRIDKLARKVFQLDDVCSSIYVVLLTNKSLRFNELYRLLIKLNPKQKSGKDFISRPTFNDHLRHLTKRKLVLAQKKGKQNVTYSLNREATDILANDSSNSPMSEWFNELEKLGFVKIDKEHYDRLTEKGLEEAVEKELNQVLEMNLLELKSFINYDLKITEDETGDEFWRFVGNPIYRMFEKAIADKCRDSERFRKKFFEKLESLIEKKNLVKELEGDSGD